MLRQFTVSGVLLMALTSPVSAQSELQEIRPQARPVPVIQPLDAIRPKERPQPLARALTALRSGQWATAALFAQPSGIVAQDLIIWQKLNAGRGTHTEAQEFLARRSDWPSASRIRRNTEDSTAKASPKEILATFSEHPAQTPTGVLAHATSLFDAKRDDEAKAVLTNAWRNWDMDSTDQTAFLKTYGELLKPHHTKRLDEMLWQGAHRNARRMFDLVDDDHKALANARIALRNRSDNATALLKKVPEKLQKNPGLLHARFEWRVRAGNWNDAKDLMRKQSFSKAKLGNPQAWSNRRRVLARDELRDGNAGIAYQLAARHHLEDGSAYADLEWLAGYIALTKLDDAKQALVHFENHDRVVQSPISQGRAGYWKGRAHTALGDTAKADMEYTRGAAFQTSFYGLLAAEAAGLPFDVGLSDVPETDWRTSPLVNDSLFQAGKMLIAAGERNLAEVFWRHLAAQLDADDAALLGQAAIDLGEPHLAVMIGKTVARQGIIIPIPYYALHPLATAKLPVKTEMALAIARRESEFDPVVKSGAGALGLMQLMPATAKEVAGQLGLGSQHQTSRLTTDPVYNAVLGTQYLATLSKQFDQNVIMVSTGYNAGPSRPERWMKNYGDPRKGSVEDMIDWIEGIPFRETRNYAMRVSESLPTYRARLGQAALPIPFSSEILGATLTPPN